MSEKTLPGLFVWSCRAGAVLTLLVAVISLGVGVYTGISSPIWMGLGFLVSAVAQFRNSFVTRERLLAYIVAQVALVVVMGFFFLVAVVTSWSVVFQR